MFSFALSRYRLVILIVIGIILWHMMKSIILNASRDTAASNGVALTSSPVHPVNVQVFYEALCPDSRSFFTKQLLPTFEKAQRLTDIVLIPYGKAKTITLQSGYSFTCQHGPIECLANKIHACVIAKVPQPDIQLKYITCMISDNINPEEIGKKCAQNFKIDWEMISACSSSSEGNDLLKKHGDATNALKPEVSFIPTVVLNNNSDKQAAILKNLFKEICNIYEEGHQNVPECN